MASTPSWGAGPDVRMFDIFGSGPPSEAAKSEASSTGPQVHLETQAEARVNLLERQVQELNTRLAGQEAVAANIEAKVIEQAAHSADLGRAVQDNTQAVAGMQDKFHQGRDQMDRIEAMIRGLANATGASHPEERPVKSPRLESQAKPE